MYILQHLSSGMKVKMDRPGLSNRGDNPEMDKLIESAYAKASQLDTNNEEMQLEIKIKELEVYDVKMCLSKEKGKFHVNIYLKWMRIIYFLIAKN